MIIEKIKNFLKPKTVVLFQGKEFISQAILDAQNIYTKAQFGKNSMWSHIGFIGTDEKFYESTVKIDIEWKTKTFVSLFGKNITTKYPYIHYVYGIYVTDLEERFTDVEKDNNLLGFLYNFKELTDEDWEKITAYGRKQKEQNIKYGGLELIGTLITLVKWRLAKTEEEKKEILMKRNPFDTSDVYCIAFVSDCFKNGCGKDLTDPKIDHSILTVDEAWYNPLLTCQRKKIIL